MDAVVDKEGCYYPFRMKVNYELFELNSEAISSR